MPDQSMNSDLVDRMRAEAHEKFDEILDAREKWRYPFVATVVVEAPGVREYFHQRGLRL